MKNKDININISPSGKKEPIYTQAAKWVTSAISNAKWTKILKVYFVMFFFLATGIMAFYAYNIVKNETFISKTADRLTNEVSEQENLRDFVVSPKVQHDIDVILYTLNADRVFIFELHNGKKNISGLPFRYADMSYEVANREAGVDRCYRNYQDIPLNMYTYPHHLFKTKIFIGTVDEIEKIDYDFAKSIREDGGKYIALCYLNGIDGPLGFLGVSFHRLDNLPDSAILESKLKEYGSKISELLDMKAQLKNINNGKK